MSFEPELELVQEPEHSIRFISHGCDSPLIRWHHHKEYELHLIACSSGKVFVGDHIGSFQPLTVYLCGPYLPHNWVTTNDRSNGVRDKVINFSEDFMLALAQTIPEARSLRPMLNSAYYGIQFGPAISRQSAHLFDEVERSHGSTRVFTFLRLLDELAQSGDYATLSTQTYDQNTDPLLEQRINKVVDYISENYQKDISLEEVSNLLHLSPNFFSRYFRKATGHRLIEFVNRLRISKACERLERTNDPITNICFEVGYANVANFNRQFRTIKGMTPREYRESLSMRNHPVGSTVAESNGR